jgi:hypothetical protein
MQANYIIGNFEVAETFLTSNFVLSPAKDSFGSKNLNPLWICFLAHKQNLCLQDQKSAEEFASYFITVMAKHMMLSIYTYLSKKSLKNVRKELESFIRYG